ncbi:RDD family protein [Pueribacillus theae]|uniref:RDD family protein n=1 Tax=Pueribacillus theae TaxID=2171751 RepID=A0A2U1K076_9BACI|nr:RDD family protein [Pueribacillus theae]PWA10423.1 RDD family protein [Pueribacillus theae]
MVSEWASLWVRLLAWIFDLLLVGVPLIVIGVTFFEKGLNMIFFDFFLFFLYVLLTPIFWQGFTVGKRILRIRIIDKKKNKISITTMIARLIVSGLIYLITFGIALIVSVIVTHLREDKRAIHDLIAGTCVTYVDAQHILKTASE